ncbi:MAG: hypothetical protein ACYCZR_02675 [Burkholderiales bacterium]
MGIDSSIALQVRPPQIATPFEQYGQLAQIQNAANQNKLAQLQFSQAQQAANDKNALSSAFSGAVKPDGTFDYNKAVTGLATAGQGAQIPAVLKQKLDYEKTAREAEKAKIEGHLQKIGALGQLIGGVKDQASYDMARQQAAQMFGPEFVAQIPPQYDPAFIQQKQQEAMTVADQLAQKWKQLDYALNVDKFGYQQKNDAANRGVQIRGQDIGANTAAAGRAVTMRGQDFARDKVLNPPNKPMPAPALKMQQEHLDAIGTASSIASDMAALKKQLKDGKLEIGPVDNLVSKARNYLGESNENSRNFGTFQATLEKMRNDSLLLNKGVQTEGDAQRAWNALFSSINDPELVKQRLGEIEAINKRAANIHRMSIDEIRKNYGNAPLDDSAFTNQPAAVGEESVDPMEGKTGTSKSGKPIVFRNGQWEYQ